MGQFSDFHQRSIQDRDAFWAEQAQQIEWHKAPQEICDYSNPPFAKWFKGGETNLCHNAIDRHLKDRGDQAALIFVSTETDQERTYTYKQLHAEVQRMAASLLSLGVKKGDRVLIYLPMMQRLPLPCWHVLELAPFTLWCLVDLPRAPWRHALKMHHPKSL